MISEPQIFRVDSFDIGKEDESLGVVPFNEGINTTFLLGVS